MTIRISSEDIVAAAAVVTAIASILGMVFALYRWYLRQNRDTEEIKKLKRENALICYALSACLDGLMQLGANHSVPTVKDKLDKYINQTAHDQMTGGK
ncbi:MAG TPA: branched-chain amino acid ABC transporter permease [Candidatus Faeciplasma gallinarum]|uniref:Branched-chain amino acid ABC transporter permease n=1 Tax=Candidatus Faeciplasma gallinarum TaxID=2840799 RepID=A0A9D1JHP6_9FIRM|nr:branched-chain amino acid ABC transporter permease [Candidatus Faeciplasma gallinarum]